MEYGARSTEYGMVKLTGRQDNHHLKLDPGNRQSFRSLCRTILLYFSLGEHEGSTRSYHYEYRTAIVDSCMNLQRKIVQLETGNKKRC